MDKRRHDELVEECGTPNDAASVAARCLDDLRLQISDSRASLTELQHEVGEARASVLAAHSARLVEVNEQLVMTALRVQADAEVAARDIAFRELTTSLRLESARLRNENRDIAETSRLKGLFLANMSHELRTPLNAIIGFSYLLREGVVGESSPKFHEYLDHIHDSGQHLLALINDVLDLSKVAAGKLDFRPEPVVLSELVGEVVSMSSTAAELKAVVISVVVEPGLDPLFVDRTKLKQVLVNYLSNAIKFSHHGGQVTVRAQAEGARLFRVEVEDAGIGISQADQARLFVEFEQIDNGDSRQHSGTGLGLALVRSLVEAQGGSVGVVSAPGKGSMFRFVLPRRC